MVLKGIVPSAYGIFPPAELTADVNSKKQKRELIQNFTKQKADCLVGKESRFVYDTVDSVSGQFLHVFQVAYVFQEPRDDDTPYTHPAIEDTIIGAFFPRKARTRALATLNLGAFDPMPLPTIVFVCTVVSVR